MDDALFASFSMPPVPPSTAKRLFNFAAAGKTRKRRNIIIIASLIGTFIPLLLDKLGIDPALATGPFITTSNDICGILIYFSIAKLILGF